MGEGGEVGGIYGRARTTGEVLGLAARMSRILELAHPDMRDVQRQPPLRPRARGGAAVSVRSVQTVPPELLYALRLAHAVQVLHQTHDQRLRVSQPAAGAPGAE